jgi:hypothetical protein
MAERVAAIQADARACRRGKHRCSGTDWHCSCPLRSARVASDREVSEGLPLVREITGHGGVADHAEDSAKSCSSGDEVVGDHCRAGARSRGDRNAGIART